VKRQIEFHPDGVTEHPKPNERTGHHSKALRTKYLFHKFEIVSPQQRRPNLVAPVSSRPAGRSSVQAQSVPEKPVFFGAHRRPNSLKPHTSLPITVKNRRRQKNLTQQDYRTKTRGEESRAHTMFQPRKIAGATNAALCRPQPARETSSPLPYPFPFSLLLKSKKRASSDTSGQCWGDGTASSKSWRLNSVGVRRGSRWLTKAVGAVATLNCAVAFGRLGSSRPGEIPQTESFWVGWGPPRPPAGFWLGAACDVAPASGQMYNDLSPDVSESSI
jgi:hypothetical protein